MDPLQPIAETELLTGLSVGYLKRLGIWKMINTYRTSGKITLNFKFQWFLTLLLGVPFPLFQFPCPVYIKVDLEKATLLLLNTLSCFQMVFKQGVFWLNIDGHAVLFSLMTKNVISSIPEYKRVQAQKIYDKIVKRCNIFCYLAVFVTFFTVCMWTFIPGIRSEYIANHIGNMNEVTTGPKKILGGWYPVPFTRSPWAEIVYTYELFLLFWCGVIVSVYEVTVTQQVMTLYAHLSVLGFHVSTLSKEEIVLYSGKKGITEREAESLLYRELLNIIRDHQKLLTYGRILKDSYNSYITMLLATGGLILIISIFQFLFGAKDVLLTIKFMLYLSFEVTEFILLCFTTTMLETSSTNIEFSIYSSEWYTSNKKLRNTAQMVMLRSQRPVSLIAVKMYPVNVETLMSIFQFTYSASALMSRMIE